MKIKINRKLKCVVDQRKRDCMQDPAHCHIIRRKVCVAKVCLNPVYIYPGHLLNQKEVDLVTSVVSAYRLELERAYRYNRFYGKDR